MKRFLFILLSISFLILPVFADNQEYVNISSEKVQTLEELIGPANKDGKIMLYFFRGEGCHFCENELK